MTLLRIASRAEDFLGAAVEDDAVPVEAAAGVEGAVDEGGAGGLYPLGSSEVGSSNLILLSRPSRPLVFGLAVLLEAGARVVVVVVAVEAAVVVGASLVEAGGL